MEQEFVCEYCDYKTKRKHDFTRHLSSSKHITIKNALKDKQNITVEKKNTVFSDDFTNDKKNCKKSKGKSNEKPFICECGKSYKFHSGYYRHKKVCNFKERKKKYDIKQRDKEKEKDKDNVKLRSIDEFTNNIHISPGNREELYSMVKDIHGIIEDQKNNPPIKQETNIHNTQNNFNVMNYLNTECKDALNIYEFIDSLPIDLIHCRQIAKEGYIQPFEDLFIKALADLEQTKRPIHCTDAKRKCSYIKTYENEWVRDNNHEQFDNALDYLQHRQVCEFRKHKYSEENWLDNDENLDFFNNFVHNVYKMNVSQNNEGPKMKRKIISKTLVSNKLLKPSNDIDSP